MRMIRSASCCILASALMMISSNVRAATTLSDRELSIISGGSGALVCNSKTDTGCSASTTCPPPPGGGSCSTCPSPLNDHCTFVPGATKNTCRGLIQTDCSGSAGYCANQVCNTFPAGNSSGSCGSYNVCDKP